MAWCQDTTFPFDDADLSIFEATYEVKPTLREIIASNPDLFYRQTWMEGEAFMDTPAEEIAFPGFMQWSYPYHPRPDSKRATAASLCLLYVKKPNDPLWEKYLWCADFDSLKQRVYIGKNNGLMEIHRHLTITSRFGVPTWDSPLNIRTTEML